MPRVKVKEQLPVAAKTVSKKRSRPSDDSPSDPAVIAMGAKKMRSSAREKLGGPSFGPTQQAQGKQTLMSPKASINLHPFAGTLKSWEKGVPVDCGPDWDWATVEVAVQRGAHRSALSTESIALVKEDVAYQVAQGYARVLSWKELQILKPKKLKISPLAVIPQRNRRGRMILDLSFPVTKPVTKGKKRSQQEVLQESVNNTTVRLAPEGPVKELGNVLPRIFAFMAEVPQQEEIHFSKLDLADGYWRMVVEEGEQWNFAYVLPTAPGEEVMIVVPRALQMGWNESPAYFCCTTETTRDVAQRWVDTKVPLTKHPLEHHTYPQSPPKRQKYEGSEFQMSSVYVDDFILAAVENSTGTLLNRTARATLHAIHEVFPAPNKASPQGAKDPISEKKLQKGDARWATQKEILGYLLDGKGRTAQLVPERAEAMIKEVTAILKKKRVPFKRFRSIVGRLRHAARILPAANAFFTPFNEAMKGSPTFVGLSRNGEVREAFLDLVAVIKDLAKRPTHVCELVQQPLDYVGFCDASAFGAGGVWFGAGKTLQPVVWRIEWPDDIRREIVSEANPKGRLTNSDLELAGVVLHEAALEATVGSEELKHAQSAIGCDNSPSVSWTNRMATRSATHTAYRLLRGLAMRQRTTRSAPPAIFHVSGEQNILADTASRTMSEKLKAHACTLLGDDAAAGGLTPNMFLTVFNSIFTLPQNKSWHNVQPNSEMLSNVISTLRGQRLAIRQWTKKLEKRAGKTGCVMPRLQPLTLGSGSSPKPSSKISSLPLPQGFELGSLGMESVLDSSLWKKPSVTWHKPSFWPATMTLAAPMAAKSLIYPSNGS